MSSGTSFYALTYFEKEITKKNERERERASTGQPVQKVTRGMSWHAPSFPPQQGKSDQDLWRVK